MNKRETDGCTERGHEIRVWCESKDAEKKKLLVQDGIT